MNVLLEVSQAIVEFKLWEVWIELTPINNYEIVNCDRWEELS